MCNGGSLLAFDIKGGKSGAFDVLNRLALVLISNNLGDAKSLATHPATTTHRALGDDGRKQAGISDSMIRLSVGLEAVDDIIADLTQALI